VNKLTRAQQQHIKRSLIDAIEWSVHFQTDLEEYVIDSDAAWKYIGQLQERLSEMWGHPNYFVDQENS